LLRGRLMSSLEPTAGDRSQICAAVLFMHAWLQGPVRGAHHGGLDQHRHCDGGLWRVPKVWTHLIGVKNRRRRIGRHQTQCRVRGVWIEKPYPWHLTYRRSYGDCHREQLILFMHDQVYLFLFPIQACTGLPIPIHACTDLPIHAWSSHTFTYSPDPLFTRDLITKIQGFFEHD
jgi:hypothetical protein